MWPAPRRVYVMIAPDTREKVYVMQKRRETHYLKFFVKHARFFSGPGDPRHATPPVACGVAHIATLPGNASTPSNVFRLATREASTAMLTKVALANGRRGST